MKGLVPNLESLVQTAVTLAGAVILGLLLYYIFFQIVIRIAHRSSPVLHDSLKRHGRRPSLIIFPLLAVYFFLPLIELPSKISSILDKALIILLITSVAWLLIKLTSVLESLVLSQYQIDEKDNLQARKIYTQVRIIKKILIFFIIIVAISAVLMSFQRFRQLGTGILASAGVAGIIIGFAAQRTLSNLLAGIQIAITQPIRLDDVVIVQNEWGRIEEITLTYVVVRIWDLRRLILPISYFIEKPFQNWTRVSADLIGSVYIYVDYTVPVQEIREEFYRILKDSKWDGRVWALQVTDSTERTMQLRAIMSAPDASTAWDLRCEVREKLVAFIKKKYPDALPKLRTELQDEKNKNMPPASGISE
jgi:small-conductance mechanosensitive channel